MITYSIINMDNYEMEETSLTAKTDEGARRQAKKEAKEQGIKKYKIGFFRTNDGCRGTIDK